MRVNGLLWSCMFNVKYINSMYTSLIQGYAKRYQILKIVFSIIVKRIFVIRNYFRFRKLYFNFKSTNGIGNIVSPIQYIITRFQYVYVRFVKKTTPDFPGVNINSILYAFTYKNKMWYNY